MGVGEEWKGHHSNGFGGRLWEEGSQQTKPYLKHFGILVPVTGKVRFGLNAVFEHFAFSS